MAFKHYTLTLSGTSTPLRLSRVLSGVVDNAEPSSAVNLPFRQLILCADPANAAAVYLGGDTSLSTTNAGLALDPTQATASDRVVLGPYDSGPVKLSDIYVIGASNERLFIAGIPY